MAQSSIRNEIIFYINGFEHRIRGTEAFLPLAQYLRYQAHLPGTKVVCAEGDCGACTTLISRCHDGTWSSFQTINSCIAPLFLFDHTSIITVEGLSHETGLNEIQEKMRRFQGAQCGYCTPGMVCALSNMADACHKNKKAITEKRVRNHLTGNLCRCTGYEPIITAALNINLDSWIPLANRYCTSEMTTTFKKTQHQDVQIEENHQSVYIPTHLRNALDFKNSNPSARIVAGATDLGVLANKGKLSLDQVLILQNIPDLQGTKETPDGLWIGAQTSLSQFEDLIVHRYPELSRLLRVFASPQIKNQGTLLGNILNGSPIGDSIPGLLVLNTVLHLQSQGAERQIPLTEFYKGYKVLDLRPDEIATGITIPLLDRSWKIKFYKVSLRKDLDISAVTFAAAVQVQDDHIVSARFALGGVGPIVTRLPTIEKDLIGKEFSEANLATAGRQARNIIKPLTDLRASENYRKQVVENLFSKFFFEETQQVSS